MVTGKIRFPNLHFWQCREGKWTFFTISTFATSNHLKIKRNRFSNILRSSYFLLTRKPLKFYMQGFGVGFIVVFF